MTKFVGAIKRFFCRADDVCKKVEVFCKLKVVFGIQSFKEALNRFFENLTVNFKKIIQKIKDLFIKSIDIFEKFVVDSLEKIRVFLNKQLDSAKLKVNKNPYYKTIKDKQLKDGIKAIKLNHVPVCNAPYTTMNFDVSGHVTACCYSRDYVLGNFYETSLNDIWFNNPKREKLLENTNKFILNTDACYLCERYIKYQNNNILITMYKKQCTPNLDKYPIRMDFEFSNICNYECVMCGGKWSSSIRKNREKMPPLKIPVNDNFIEELEEYIPHLKFAGFLGGEPFLSNHYFKIWEKMAELNKDVEISIVTNGSIYNEKVQKVLDSFKNLIICVSLDSLKPDVYSSIRRNGNLENVLNNIRIFKEQGKLCWINTCAMIQNIYEAPELLEFCHKNDVGITFLPVDDALGGTVKGIHENGENEGVSNGSCRELMETPCDEIIPEFRLKTLPKSELENILKMVENIEEEKKDIYKQNLKDSISALKHQVMGYIEEKK